MKQKINCSKKMLLGLLLFLMVLCFTGCSGDAGVEPETELATEEEIPYVEVTVADEIFVDKFYYGLLEAEDQLTYKEIYQGILNHQEEIYIHGTDLEQQFVILDYVVYDFPELFWVDASSESTSYEGGYSVIEPDFVCTKEEREKRAAEIEAAATAILNQIPAEYSEYEKIKFVYEYLVNTVDYVEEAPDNQNIYSTLVNKQTVCAGYARANQYLLNEMDIFCTFVLGTTIETDENSGGHAWNIVQCGENYYIVDVTWADPKEAEGAAQLEDVMVYDYLCCSQETIASTHFEDETYPYPECVSNDLEYYRINKLLYEEVNKKEIRNELKSAVKKKEAYTVLKFANAELYKTAKSKIYDDIMQDVTNYYCDLYGKKEMLYYTQEDERLNKLTIYWVYE